MKKTDADNWNLQTWANSDFLRSFWNKSLPFLYSREWVTIWLLNSVRKGLFCVFYPRQETIKKVLQYVDIVGLVLFLTLFVLGFQRREGNEPFLSKFLIYKVIRMSIYLLVMF